MGSGFSLREYRERLRDAVTDLPILPVDKRGEGCNLQQRRGGISVRGRSPKDKQPLSKPRYKRRGAMCYDKDDLYALYIRNIGDAVSKRCESAVSMDSSGSDMQFFDLPNVPENGLSSITMPPVRNVYARRSSLPEISSPAVAFKAILKGSVLDTVGLESYCNDNRKFHNVDTWEFDVFAFWRMCGGRPLYHLGLYVFQQHELASTFKINQMKLMKFLSLVEHCYHGTNPYHNSVHATDVTQALSCLLLSRGIYSKLTRCEVLAAIIAAIVHDVDHPGVNQNFLSNTSNYLVIIHKVHNNESTLERHHCRTAKALIKESGILENLSDAERTEVLDLMTELVMATDISKHREIVQMFEDRVNSNRFDLDSPEDRCVLLKIILKCADISNPGRPWELCKQWSKQIMEEFFKQGDSERSMNLPISILCDRETTDIPRSQTGFIEHLVEPLFLMWREHFNNDLSQTICGHIGINRMHWLELVKEPQTTD